MFESCLIKQFKIQMDAYKAKQIIKTFFASIITVAKYAIEILKS